MTTTTEATTAPPPGRRVTPTGRLILPADADRADWLTARRSGIGSSDIAAVLGISRYGNALSVYYDKTGGLPLESDDSEPALWGRLIEETVAREWARRNRSVVRRVGLVANVDRPWQMCTLDRLVLECPLATERERCALEIKCRDKMKASSFRAGVADDVLVQTLWQADTTGYDHIHAAVLLGGNDYRQYVIRPRDHAQLVADLRAAGTQLWQHITTRTPPQPPAGDFEPGPLLDLYDQLHPHRDGLIALDRQAAAIDDVAEYVEAAAAESAAKKRKERAKARLVGHLGDADTALLNGTTAYTYLPAARSYCDTGRLAERWPQAYADCVADRESRTLRISTSIRKDFTP